jgi:hypothetical protein
LLPVLVDASSGILQVEIVGIEVLANLHEPRRLVEVLAQVLERSRMNIQRWTSKWAVNHRLARRR